MTLSISAEQFHDHHSRITLIRCPDMRKTCFVYLSVSVICIFVNQIYAMFGHGVSSAAMSWMFLYPFLGGMVPSALLWIRSKKTGYSSVGRMACNSHHSGIAALTVGSMLRGVFEIAGTSSPYLFVYTTAGCLLIGLGLMIGLRDFWRNRLRRSARLGRSGSTDAVSGSPRT